MEREIRKSIMHSMRKEESEEQRKIEKQNEHKREELYQNAHQQALLSFANKAHTKVIKIFEHGSPRKEGEDLFDAIFERKKEKIAFSTFRPGTNEIILNLFLTNSLSELQAGTIAHLVILLFTEENCGTTSETITKVLSLVPDSVSQRVDSVMSRFDDVENAIGELNFDVKSAAATPDAG